MDLKELIELKKNSMITLRESITLEELYDLMKKRWPSSIPGSFKLKKTFFSKCIEFDYYLMVYINVRIASPIVLGQKSTVKNNTVCVDFQQLDPSSAAKSPEVQAVGGYEKAVPLSGEYYKAVVEAMREVLKDKIAT